MDSVLLYVLIFRFNSLLYTWLIHFCCVLPMQLDRKHSAACYRSCSYCFTTFFLILVKFSSFTNKCRSKAKGPRMPARRQEGVRTNGAEEESTKQPNLYNIANRGLCSMSKSGKLQNAADCSIILVGTARCSSHNIKGFMFGLKHYPSRVKEVE